MNKSYSRGFTLIELLTVVAIIAILAAFTMTVGPRLIERAKMRRMDSALRQVATALIAYNIDYQTYPPAYGYVGFEHVNNPNPPANPEDEPNYYHLVPYMARLKYHGNEEMYDEFSISYDTVNNGQIGLLEFSPVGMKLPDGTYRLDSNLPRYTGAPAAIFSQEIDRQLTATRRPFIYIPINKLQFSRAQKYWLQQGDAYAETWDSTNPLLANLTFPPRNYDAFVLIGVGPSGNTFGILPETTVQAELENDERNLYHIRALRAYYLATRDLNANSLLDFDFRARTQQGEGKHVYNVSYPDSAFSGSVSNELPPWTLMRNGAGPIINVNP